MNGAGGVNDIDSNVADLAKAISTLVQAHKLGNH